jgi:hypothetical protein
MLAILLAFGILVVGGAIAVIWLFFASEDDNR